MKLNKNGWGTLEMFLLSGGLLVALLIAIYFISILYGNLEKASQNRQYIDLENRLENAAKQYISDNSIDVFDAQTISYTTLYNLGYINNFVDSNGNQCDGYVVIDIIDNVNYYYAFIKCGKYQTNNNNL